ncbi:plasma-membrane calcium-translocating P-type ATPase [Micrococcales bacterium KH10]|nr:plasma-membrane calcium-translocating P-type ATPase [Micrococcales bacterium KH10]
MDEIEPWARRFLVATFSPGPDNERVTPNTASDQTAPADSGNTGRFLASNAFALDPDEVLAAVESSTAGLTSDDVAHRLAHVGPNCLPAPQRPSALRRYLSHFDDVLIYILVAAAVLKALMGDWVDCIVVFAVAVINATIGFVQEGRAENALAAIRGMLSTAANVLRNGQWSNIDAEELVPGDVVRVRSGDRVPADLRLIEETNLRAEESALTGEAVSSSKDVAPVPEDAGVGDRSSMLFSGTLISSGQGVGVVTATGGHTQIGQIQAMVTEAGQDELETPLGRQLAKFGKFLSIAILLMAVVMLLVGRIIHDFAADDLISAAIGFAVAAVPEGLPALVTITLALGVQQMARRRAITRRLPAVETLGAVTTICSDKTGTLTQNEMTVRTIVTAERSFDVLGTGYSPAGEIRLHDVRVEIADLPDLAAAITTFAVCNDATVRPASSDSNNDDDRWVVVGEPTEGAIAALAAKSGVEPAGWQRRATLPFESAHKYMAVYAGRDADATGGLVLVKGAPDRVLARCATQRNADGEVEPLDEAYWNEWIERLSNQGLRVLGAAQRDGSVSDVDLDHTSVAAGLTMVGLVGIVDPPRPEAITAIEQCHEASIGVKMITGDHAGTARAIALEMGIISDPEARVLTGADIEAMPQGRLERLAPKVDVFARTSPEHKIRIVRALQARGQVVSMTGDGVNDAPALTRADVGIAMGIKGTEATKDAADIVLADDNFATIERAVEEGRRIYDNIKKSVEFLLPTNGAQAIVMLVAVLAGWTLPLEPTQILWVNMVTAVTLSLTLAYEPAEPGLMSRPPRNSHAPLITRNSLFQVMFVSLLIGAATLVMFQFARDRGWSIDQSQTVAVNTLVFGQVAYLFNCRFRHSSSLRWAVLTGNRVLWISIGILVAVQALFVYLPWLNSLFGSASVDIRGWIGPVVIALIVFVAVEVLKAIIRRVSTRALAGQ